jgi:hypothetical protein
MRSAPHGRGRCCDERDDGSHQGGARARHPQSGPARGQRPQCDPARPRAAGCERDEAGRPERRAHARRVCVEQRPGGPVDLDPDTDREHGRVDGSLVERQPRARDGTGRERPGQCAAEQESRDTGAVAQQPVEPEQPEEVDDRRVDAPADDLARAAADARVGDVVAREQRERGEVGLAQGDDRPGDCDRERPEDERHVPRARVRPRPPFAIRKEEPRQRRAPGKQELHAEPTEDGEHEDRRRVGEREDHARRRPRSQEAAAEPHETGDRHRVRQQVPRRLRDPRATAEGADQRGQRQRLGCRREHAGRRVHRTKTSGEPFIGAQATRS